MVNTYKYNRRSLRLKHYDYSKAGYYFITICTQDRLHLFGEILNGEMVLGEVGEIVNKWYMKLEEKFPNITNHEMVIMPNHMHFIMEIVDTVGADLCVRPNVNTEMLDTQLKIENIQSKRIGTQSQRADTRVRPYVGDVVQWFKTMTTNAYIKMVKNGTLPPFNKRIWQRNYHEHIIRNDVDYLCVAEYTLNNPLTWEDDVLSKSYNNS